MKFLIEGLLVLFAILSLATLVASVPTTTM